MKIKKTATVKTAPAPVAKAVAKKKTATVALPAPAPEATAAPAPRAKADAPAKGEVTLLRNLSATTFPADHPFFPARRARIMEFQDFTFAQNAAAPETARLTDAQLAELWAQEFPRAVKFNEKHVAGARRDFLVNRHSKTFATLTAEVAIATLSARTPATKKKVAA